MRSERNILLVFILNLFFSVIELIGGLFTRSNAILSDAVHDLGDALSVGLAYLFEKKSKKKPDNKYTYGYSRYSIVGSFITTVILVVSSFMIIIHSIKKLIAPVVINYDGMIFFAIIGILINGIAAFFTNEEGSLNQKTVRLHMLEDVLGWIVVLIGAFIIKFTGLFVIDSILSIVVALFILYQAFRNLKTILDLFLEKIPNDISIDELKEHILEIDGVNNVHHVHVWSMDGINNCATMHVVVSNFDKNIKNEIRQELSEHGISHVTIELELNNEDCCDSECVVKEFKTHHHHHHHKH